MSLNSRFSSHAVSRVQARKTDEAAKLRRAFLILSAASALTLCSIGLAHAETWVTVNADGSTTRTETTSSAAMPAQSNARYNENNDVYPDDYEARSTRPAVSGATTTFFSGTYYPIPQTYYGYPQPNYNYNVQPPGYTYPIGPVYPRVTPPLITNGPAVSNVPTYVYPGYGYYGPPGHYPYPAYNYPAYNYPAYGMNGTYYSGPAGGGGTIYSSSTTQNRGTGLSFGNGGLNIQIGGGSRTTSSTTTVTTTAPR